MAELKSVESGLPVVSRPRSGPSGLPVRAGVPANDSRRRGLAGKSGPTRPHPAGGRLPRAAAVTVKSSSKDVSYAAILKKARSSFRVFLSWSLGWRRPGLERRPTVGS